MSRGIPPAGRPPLPRLPPSSSSLFARSSSSSFLVHSFSRATLFIHANVFPSPPPLPYHATATRRVSLTSSTSLSWVRGCVCNARNVLGTQDPRRQSITPSRSRRTRTLLSPYVNELLIFRASDFFVSFFFISLIRRALHRLPSVFRLSLLPRLPRTTRSEQCLPLQSGN